MNDRFRQAFDQIHAEEALVESTREYVLCKARGRRRRKVACALAASMTCALLVAGGAKSFLTPVSVISIDVNPSIELGVNRFDRVVSVEGMNDDGSRLADRLDVRFEDYTAAVDEVLRVLQLPEDEIISITVVGGNEDKNSRMLTEVQGCAEGYSQVHCYSASFGKTEEGEAHSSGLSCGKYRAFLELRSLDPNVTVEDVQGWTMREIQDRINALIDAVGAENNGTASGTPSASPEEVYHAEEHSSGHNHRKGHH